MKNAKNDPGLSETFQASYQDTFQAALNVLNAQGADIVESNQTERYIYAKQGMDHVALGSFTYGEVLGLYFDEKSAVETKIKITEKKKFKMGLLKNEWALKIFSAVRTQLYYNEKMKKQEKS